MSSGGVSVHAACYFNVDVGGVSGEDSVMTGPLAHSKYGASSFDANARCPGRRVMSRGKPDTPSKAADYGIIVYENAQTKTPLPIGVFLFIEDSFSIWRAYIGWGETYIHIFNICRAMELFIEI